MRLLEPGEVWKGLTDVPIFLAALVFAFLILKNGGTDRKRWFIEYLLIAVGGMLGSVVHCFAMPLAANKALWVVLYIFLYGLVWLFFSLMFKALMGREPDRKWLYACIACYVASCLLKLLINRADIYVFVAYAMPPAAVLIAECIRHGKEAARERTVMILLGLAILSQATNAFLGSAPVVVAHLLVFAAMLALYEVAKNTNGENNHE